MFDVVTGWKISVKSTSTDGSYVIVPARQAEALCRLLSEHRIPHAVDWDLPSRHQAEAPPEELVVRLAHTAEVAHVQDLLDLAP
jgi:hypothetical protein